MRWTLALLLSLAPATAEAARTGAVRLEGGSALGVVLQQVRGTLPQLELAGDRVERTAVWIHARGGVVQTNSTSDLGSQLGVAYELRLGITPRDTDRGGDGVPVGFAGRLEMVYRTYTFQLPADGMIALHVGGELGAGGAHWWSDSARWSFLGGVLLAVGPEEGSGFEVDYTLVPHVFGSAPSDLTVNRTEHRLRATIGSDGLGIGVWATLFVERSKREGGAFVRTTGTIAGIGVEWR